MPPKRSAPKTPPGTNNGPPQKKGKTQDNGTEAAEKRNEEYTWISCDCESDDLKRLEIKEEACRQAEIHAAKIQKILLPMLTLPSVSDSDEASPSNSSVEELNDWVAQLGMCSTGLMEAPT